MWWAKRMVQNNASALKCKHQEGLISAVQGNGMTGSCFSDLFNLWSKVLGLKIKNRPRETEVKVGLQAILKTPVILNNFVSFSVHVTSQISSQMSLSYHHKELGALFFPTHSLLNVLVMLNELWTSQRCFRQWSLVRCLSFLEELRLFLISAALKVTKQLSMGFRDKLSLS